MIAGLDVLRIINEPTAAAIAYGLDKRDTGSQVKDRQVSPSNLSSGPSSWPLLSVICRETLQIK